MTSQKFFTLFLLCLLLPLLIAKISLSKGWFTHISTNNGEWFDQDRQLLPSINTAAVRWRLVYVVATECDQQCEQTLYLLQQLYVGLGRKQHNISTIILATKSPADLSNFPAVKWQPALTPLTDLHNNIVIVNQRGMALLRYPMIDDAKKINTSANNIRADLLRLMNYDRGGV